MPSCQGSSGQKLGTERWAYIPQDLLPQLRWLTKTNYSHVYYVDLKPKVTEARIFDPNDPAHPGGWGTILVGGFRMGGSCAKCSPTRGGPRVVTADFGNGMETRTFLSSYFVLDITDPEREPVLLWTFRDQELGFTTAAPAVFRVNDQAGSSNATDKWYVVFGTGPTHYDGSSSQTAQMFAVDLKQGPRYNVGNMNRINGTDRSGIACSITKPCILADIGAGTTVQRFSSGTIGFMGDAITVDFNLDYRVDVVYAGTVSCQGDTPNPCNGSDPIWKGAMWRLTLKGGTSDPAGWGVESAPTKLISAFESGSPLGPVFTAPISSMDDDRNLWIYFGSGRYFANSDKINNDPQYFVGVKDSFLTVSTSQDQTDERNLLVDVTNVAICIENCGGSGSGLESVADRVREVNGWFVVLQNGPRERNLSPATLLGGTVFFASFSPSDDFCEGGGNGRLYALYYQSGTGSTQPQLGTAASGGGQTTAVPSVDLGAGLPSQVVLHVGSRGTDQVGQGCKTAVTVSVGESHGEILSRCTGPVLLSRVIAWRDI
jgi:type IV pilus assembly protein PilY1